MHVCCHSSSIYQYAEMILTIATEKDRKSAGKSSLLKKFAGCQSNEHLAHKIYFL